MASGLYPNVEILNLGTLTIDTARKAELVAKLPVVNDTLVLNDFNLSDTDQDFLNHLVAPMFIFQLYYHPITQTSLMFKQRTDDDREMYDYYYGYVSEFFHFLTIKEILALLGTNLNELYLYRLRNGDRDRRDLETILREDYGGRTLEEVLSEKYLDVYSIVGGGGHKFLWELLFSREN